MDGVLRGHVLAQAERRELIAHEALLLGAEHAIGRYDGIEEIDPAVDGIGIELVQAVLGLETKRV